MTADKNSATDKIVGSSDGLESVDYLLECFNGGSFYVPIHSLYELDKWRTENPHFIGTLYTHDGHSINEDAWREESNYISAPEKLPKSG